MYRHRFCQVEAERLCSLHMRTALYVLLALAAPALAGQTVYTWKDEKGVTHFSDQPQPGAEKMELQASPKPAATPAPTYSSPTSTPAPAKAGPVYSRFVITSPQQDQTFANTGGKVSVQLAATPNIGNGHTVALYLDGSPVSDFPPMSTTYEFAEMPRGTHTLKAVVSQNGKQIQETPPVTFHVRQESAAKPPVGPTVRPSTPKRTAGNKLRTTQPTYQALNGGKATIDPSTNKPVVTKPATTTGPKN